MKSLLFFLTYVLIFLSKSLIASEKNIKFICKNKSNVEEFILTIDNNKTWGKVLKKINGKFISAGKVVGQKHLSFILFEDKYKYLGVDFAWHLDQNTMRLKPVLLSEGTIKLKERSKNLLCSKK